MQIVWLWFERPYPVSHLRYVFPDEHEAAA
jgi:hypothetical protein